MCASTSRVIALPTTFSLWKILLVLRKISRLSTTCKQRHTLIQLLSYNMTCILTSKTFSYAETAGLGKEWSATSAYHIELYNSSLALLTYDTLLTLGDEIRLIWDKRFNLGSALYILARYCAFISSLLPMINDIIDISVEVWAFPSQITCFAGNDTNTHSFLVISFID